MATSVDSPSTIAPDKLTPVLSRGGPANDDAYRRSNYKRRTLRPRRGVTTLWLLLLLPLFFILFCFVVEIGNLWLARAELEDALEAAALAAVKEWGDAGGGSTVIPRDIGVEYATANTVRNRSVTIAPNYNVLIAPNENNDCNGNLVFGAFTSTAPSVVFDAGVAPSCSSQSGSVLFDVTTQGSLNSDNLHHAWGIAFGKTASTPANLKIDSITITLPTGNFRFNKPDSPLLSTAPAGSYKVVSVSGLREQPDIAGFNNPSAQISFVPSTGTPSQVTINFSPDGPDQGFEPGDRFRFAAETSNLGVQGGDSIGLIGAQVSVVFNLGGTLATVGDTYLDTDHDKALCVDQPDDPLTGSLVVHPTGLPDLPCPSGNSGNNGQSLVFVQDPYSGGGGGGGSGDPFGVRAQATVDVNTICGSLLGGLLSPFSVSARTTAIYDCTTNEVRLIRVEQFICP